MGHRNQANRTQNCRFRGPGGVEMLMEVKGEREQKRLTEVEPSDCNAGLTLVRRGGRGGGEDRGQG